jgi:hypothetical protein
MHLQQWLTTIGAIVVISRYYYSSYHVITLKMSIMRNYKVNGCMAFAMIPPPLLFLPAS